MTRSWQTTSSKVVYENRWMIVHEDTVILPNGKDGLYGYIDSKSDSVYVVPVDSEGNTYIVQQERYTSRRKTWECVAGRNEGDAPRDAAERELFEETGLKAVQFTSLGAVDVANGITTFKSTFFLATDVTQESTQYDEEDGILGIRKVPLASLPAMILAGEITCTQSIAAFFMAIAYREQQKEI